MFENTKNMQHTMKLKKQLLECYDNEGLLQKVFRSTQRPLRLVMLDSRLYAFSNEIPSGIKKCKRMLMEKSN